MISQYGRKVFFINPPETLNETLLEEIFKKEFEIYLLKNSEKLEKILDIFSNSIIFINIDEERNSFEWVDYIRSIHNNPKYKNIVIGVFSKKDSKSLKDELLMDIGIGGGYILLDKNQWETVGVITQVLEFNEARGRRSHVRYDLKSIKESDTLDVKIYSMKGNLYRGEVKSFSAAGFLVEIDKEHRETFIKEQVDKIIFYIDGKDHHVQGINLNQISETDFFLKFEHIEEGDREDVQSFIFKSLQNSFQKLLNTL